MMHKSSKRKIFLTITAVLCIVVFAVLLSIARDPSLLKGNNGNAAVFEYGDDFIKFIDVGQGDSALIYSNGYSAVIDMGISPAADDIIDALSECKIDAVDMVIISHYHSDHIGAFEEVAEAYKIKNMIGPKINSNSIKAAKTAQESVISNGGNFYEAVYGLNFMLGEFKITVLGYYNAVDENNRSVYVMAEIDDVRFLFTGDGEIAAEKQLMNRAEDIDCDVLKVAHHGSKTSTGYEFLKATTPEYAVISVGEGNSYNHPNIETLVALENQAAEIYRTDTMGDISFYVDSGEIKIITEK